jgi:hypothetical protein
MKYTPVHDTVPGSGVVAIVEALGHAGDPGTPDPPVEGQPIVVATRARDVRRIDSFWRRRIVISLRVP